MEKQQDKEVQNQGAIQLDSDDEEISDVLSKQLLQKKIEQTIRVKNKQRCLPTKEAGEKAYIRVKLTPIASAPVLSNSQFNVNQNHKLIKLIKYLKKELKGQYKIHCNQFVPSPDITFADLAANFAVTKGELYLQYYQQEAWG